MGARVWGTSRRGAQNILTASVTQTPAVPAGEFRPSGLAPASRAGSPHPHAPCWGSRLSKLDALSLEDFSHCPFYKAIKIKTKPKTFTELSIHLSKTLKGPNFEQLY